MREIASIPQNAAPLISAGTITIDLASDDIRVAQRTTTQPVRSIKPSSPARPPLFPRPSGKHVLGQIRQGSGGTRQELFARHNRRNAIAGAVWRAVG